MAERIPPPSDPSPRHSSDISNPPNPPPHRLHVPDSSQFIPVFESGTYVVQVPKDQIYRVPPPENARFIQQRQIPEQKKRRSYFSRRRCCSCCFVFILICVTALGVSLGLSFGLGTSKKPEFQIRHFAMKSSSHRSKSSYDYDLDLIVRNPNAKSEIQYKNNGIASLFVKDSKLGESKFPTFDQVGDNSTEIELAIKGSAVPLPETMKKSLRDSDSKSHVSFSLTLSLPTKMWKDINLSISCNFKVDTLARGTRVINQKCVTDNR